MHQSELIKKLQSYQGKVDTDLVERAYIKASIAHDAQKRKTGEPFINHPYEVATILMHYKMDSTTIAAALLHDVIEDTPVTKEDIEKDFGKDIAFIVDGLTKLKRVNVLNNGHYNAQNFKKFVQAIFTDIRVLLIKLADRLHNMRTISFMSPSKQKSIATETLNVYAPLAKLIGIESISAELEDISFKILHPKQYSEIVNRLHDLDSEKKTLVEETKQILKEKMLQEGIDASILGRIKAPFSIWKKMHIRNVSFRKISDIYGFRILVKELQECYTVLGIIHNAFPVVPGCFKDYISLPKKNGYSSLHTAVWIPNKQRMELQIRTYEMDENARLGVASHAWYKIYNDSEKNQWHMNESIKRLRQTFELLQNNELNPEDFFQNALREINTENIYCYTPQGEIIFLPRNACALDFAYNVHTEIGSRAKGCYINEQRRSLSDILKNGDEVYIETAQQEQYQEYYLNFLQTGKARSLIRKRMTEEKLRTYYSDGMQIIKRRAARAEISVGENSLNAVAIQLQYQNARQVVIALGKEEIERDFFFKALIDNLPQHRLTEDIKKTLLSRSQDVNMGGLPISGGGHERRLNFGDSVGAVPGDTIVGIDDGDKAIAVYNVDSQSFKKLEKTIGKKRIYDLRWNINDHNKKRFHATLSMSFYDQVGAIATIAKKLSDNDVDITNMVLLKIDKMYRLRIDIGVYNAQDIHKLMMILRKLPLINQVERSLS